MLKNRKEENIARIFPFQESVFLSLQVLVRTNIFACQLRIENTSVHFLETMNAFKLATKINLKEE